MGDWQTLFQQESMRWEFWGFRDSSFILLPLLAHQWDVPWSPSWKSKHRNISPLFFMSVMSSFPSFSKVCISEIAEYFPEVWFKTNFRVSWVKKNGFHIKIIDFSIAKAKYVWIPWASTAASHFPRRDHVATRAQTWHIRILLSMFHVWLIHWWVEMADVWELWAPCRWEWNTNIYCRYRPLKEHTDHLGVSGGSGGLYSCKIRSN